MWVAKRHRNVFLDISLQGGHAFGAACEEVGADKLLYGSDAPYASPGSMKRIIEESSLAAADKELILGGNAARLLHLAAGEAA
jgi:predicted TIM-barrel fold metal-dependent hydrolase